MSICRQLLVLGLAAGLGPGMGAAWAQTPVPATPKQAPTAPAGAPSGTTPAPATPEAAPTAPKDAPGGTTAVPATPKQTPTLPKDAPSGATPEPATPEPKPQAPTPGTPGTPGTPPPARQLAPPGKPQTQEFEPNASPTTPRLATTETVDVPARPVVMVKGEASFDDAFKTIKAALDKAKAALARAGLTQTGHELAIVTDTDEKGLKFQAALPIGEKPAGKSDLGDGVTIGTSPAGPALKFRHLGPYDDIDRTYATITSYLDNKGLEATSPFIEEYPDDLKNDDDPKLAVDIYIFIKK